MEEHIQITAIILAAGLSSRMGGTQKLVMPYRGQPLIKYMLTALDRSSLVSEVIVVTGHDRLAVDAICSEQNVNTVFNQDFSKGLSASILTGVKSVESRADGILICHGDMPNISEIHIQQLCEAFIQESEKIIMPSYKGKQGNPVLWPKKYFSQLMALSGDKGAKSILHNNIEDIFEVSFADEAIMFDVDDKDTLSRD